MNRYFYPDESATSQILTELATAMARDFSVAVITSRQSASDVSARFGPKDVVDGVSVVRLWTTRLGRSSLWRRALDYLSFHAAVVLYLLRHVTRNDVVVLKTDPPLLQLVNTSVIRLKGGKVINWLQDIYPEIAVRLGKFPGPRWFAKMMMAWRDRALRAASANVVVSDSMAGYLRGRGVMNTQVITNWADEGEITPVEHENNPLRAEWGLQGKFTVMYSGNFGRAHTFSEIAGAALQLASETDIQFIFVGDGAGLSGLREQMEAAPGGNFVFRPFQPKDRLRFSLGAADLHLMSLKPGMEDLLMPSKLYGILAAGRSIGFVGDPDGSLASMICEENLGFAAPIGDSAALAEAILGIKRNPSLRDSRQDRARAFFEASCTRGMAAKRWHRLLAGMDSAAAV